MTITNKAQGQSLNITGVDPRRDCFSPMGSCMWPAPRLLSPDRLVTLQPESKTKIVVFKEVMAYKIVKTLNSKG